MLVGYTGCWKVLIGHKLYEEGFYYNNAGCRSDFSISTDTSAV